MKINAMSSFLCGAAVLALVTSLCFGHSSGSETNQDDVAPNTDAVRIMVQPMMYNPTKWNIGDRLTVMVTCESDDGPTRVIGIATDIELAAIKTFDNRWEMWLRSTREGIAKIRAAADLSEYWFTITPFTEKHRKLVADAPGIAIP